MSEKTGGGRHTPEQIENLMRYGWCKLCHAPRETKLTSAIEEGKTIYTYGIVCPNGHPQ